MALEVFNERPVGFLASTWRSCDRHESTVRCCCSTVLLRSLKTRYRRASCRPFILAHRRSLALHEDGGLR